MTVRFIQISDTHIGATQDSTFRTYAPYPKCEALIKYINALDVELDFVVHTGDVCGDKATHATSAHYELAKGLFDRLKVPVYYVAGNHDAPELMKQGLSFGAHENLSDTEESLAYRFTLNGELFLCVDARVGPQRGGHLSEQHLAQIKEAIESHPGGVIIFTHYPILPVGCPWIDDTMLVDNGSKLHDLLTPHASRVRGVFHGHIHQSILYRRQHNCQKSFHFGCLEYKLL